MAPATPVVAFALPDEISISPDPPMYEEPDRIATLPESADDADAMTTLPLLSVVELDFPVIMRMSPPGLEKELPAVKMTEPPKTPLPAEILMLDPLYPVPPTTLMLPAAAVES